MDPVGLARIGLASATPGAVILVALAGRAGEGPEVVVELWADRDDDDANGVPDGEQALVPLAARADLVAIPARLTGVHAEVVAGATHARLVTGEGKPVPWGGTLPVAGYLQGLSAGRVELTATGRDSTSVKVVLNVGGIEMRDGEGIRVDMARSHASLERSQPTRIEGPADAPYADFDALRVVVAATDEKLGFSSVDSVSPRGARIDTIDGLALRPVACPAGYVGLRCSASAPLRCVVDDEDRNHPLVKERSIKAVVGGAIVFRAGGRKAQMIRVMGPRSSPAGPIGVLRASLRPFVMRVVAGGAPAIGGGDAGAVATLRTELGAASAIWGQCGLTFGDPAKLDVRVVDPPPPHLVAVGDGLGIVSGGGEIHLRIDGRPLTVATTPGETPDGVALDIARAGDRAGFSCRVSSNARIAPGLGPSADVSFRRRDGALASADRDPAAPLSTDATLSVRIGSVDLSDGLHHFTDMDSMAGTLEERTLLKALDDGDPTTLEVVVVPLFGGALFGGGLAGGGGGRIGESFIASDRSSIRNVVLLDRAGIRARKSSLTLAHELGHVLLDLAGHPDDYGVDTPTFLMDSDAADESPFGPRRISLEECARVVRESGPGARLPLLTEVPLQPIPMLR